MLDICEKMDNGPTHVDYQGLKKVCAVLGTERQVLVVPLFKRCFPAEKYTPEKAQCLLSCVPLLLVKVLRDKTPNSKFQGGYEYMAYARPSDVVTFTANLTKAIVRAKAHGRVAMSRDTLKQLLSVSTNLQEKERLEYPVRMTLQLWERNHIFCNVVGPQPAGITRVLPAAVQGLEFEGLRGFEGVWRVWGIEVRV